MTLDETQNSLWFQLTAAMPSYTLKFLVIFFVTDMELNYTGLLISYWYERNELGPCRGVYNDSNSIGPWHFYDLYLVVMEIQILILNFMLFCVFNTLKGNMYVFHNRGKIYFLNAGTNGHHLT